MCHIIEINDFSCPEMDIYTRYNENQLRTYNEPAPGIFIAESPNVIARALNAGYEPISLLVNKKEFDNSPTQDIINQCGQSTVFVAEAHILNQLTGFAMTRGLLCAMKRKELSSISDICASARRIAVLENVMNPTNVGAIFRSAAALGIDAILLTAGCSDPLYRRAARVSMGTVFQIPWTWIPSEKITNCTANNKNDTSVTSLCYVESLKKLGFHTAAMALDANSVNIDYPPLNSCKKLAILLGSEGYGLCPETIASCDYTVCIPMTHGVDSLNVAAASAVAFWQLCHPIH